QLLVEGTAVQETAQFSFSRSIDGSQVMG
ncbi:MAG: hypothetical protein QOF58_8875, partial [Pseudonocardiales bacterium]|nr:hypothetical protein [Pseudonocardiales bacterium]